MSDDDRLLIGRVARAHGKRGDVIVNPETDFAAERFRAGAVVFVGEGRTPRCIRHVRFQNGRPIVGLDGIATIDDAEALAGAELLVDAAALSPLPPGTYYHHDLIGCEVVDTGQSRLGTVTAVEGPMDRSTLVIDAGGDEVLVPLAAEICQSVDTAARRIVVKMPEGLLELNRKGSGS
jgi:16S rRNA processing protein RimM